MKKLCLLLSTISLCIFCLVFLSSCSSELDAPRNFKLDAATQTLSWSKTKDATGYTVVINDIEVVTYATS